MIGNIPTILFTMYVRNYLSEKEYRAFLNCDHQNFDIIKHETVMYSICFTNNAMNQNYEEIFVSFLRKVKDKSKQIKLILYDLSPIMVYNLSKLWKGIHLLKIFENKDDPFPDGLDFSIFNDIQHVSLQEFRNIRCISLGLQNIQHLTIRKFPKLHEISCFQENQEETLESLVITSCPLLSSIHKLHNIPEIHLLGNGLNDKMKITGNKLRTFHLHCPVIPLRWLETIDLYHFKPNTKQSHPATDIVNENHNPHKQQQQLLQSSPTSSCRFYDQVHQSLSAPMKEIKLQGSFPKSFPHWQALCLTEKLTLIHLGKITNVIAPSNFPTTFQGSSLFLHTFDLSTWNSAILSNNLQSLKLYSCSGIIHFPQVSQLKRLILYDLRDLISFPMEGFPQCEYFELEYLTNDVILPSLPNCIALKISKCYGHIDGKGFEQFSSVYSLTKVEINDCTSLRSLSMFSHVSTLKISNCEHIENCIGLEKYSSRTYRTIFLHNLKKLMNFDGLEHIHLLHLSNLNGLRSGNGLNDIDHLIIDSCNQLRSTNDFQNIHESITFIHCTSLRMITKDLCGIPKLEIRRIRCPIEDYTGFANHSLVKVEDVFSIEELMEAIENNQHVPKDLMQIFRSIDKLISSKWGMLIRGNFIRSPSAMATKK